MWFSVFNTHIHTHTHLAAGGSIVVIETLSLDKWLLPRAVRLTLTEQSTLCYLCLADKESFLALARTEQSHCVPSCPIQGSERHDRAWVMEHWTWIYCLVNGPTFELLSHVMESRPSLFMGNLLRWTSCHAMSPECIFKLGNKIKHAVTCLQKETQHLLSLLTIWCQLFYQEKPNRCILMYAGDVLKWRTVEEQ